MTVLVESKKFKSILKEFCDSQGIAQPVYSHVAVGQQWTVHMTLSDGQVLSSDVVANKKVGEEQVAAKAVAALRLLHPNVNAALSAPAVAAAAAAAAASAVVHDGMLLPESVRVLVDTDNVPFCDAAFCARFPFARFEQFVSFERNVPTIVDAAQRCANVRLVRATAAFKEASDLMIVISATRLFDRITSPTRSAFDALGRIVIVSKDHMVLKAATLFHDNIVQVAANVEALEQLLLNNR